MNTRLVYTGCMLCALLVSGCSDDFDPNGNLQPALSPHYLNVSATSFNHSAEAFTESFMVESVQTPWKFSSIADWISISPQSGNSSASVSMNVEENLSAVNARTSVFYLESDNSEFDFNRAISVSQSKAEAFLNVDVESLSFSGATASKVVKIVANCEWNATSPQDWISIQKDMEAGSITVGVSANPTESERTGYVTVYYGDSKSISIKVAQAPSSIAVSETTLQYENVASKYDIIVDSEMDWTSSASESWIQVTPDKGNSGKTTVSIEVAPNTAVSQRSGFVNIYTGANARLQISVIQKGIYIEADSSLEFSSLQESKTLNINSNTDWEVLASPDWLTLSMTSGSGNGEITVTSQDNPNTTGRQGKIEIGQAALSLKTTVKVTQAGKTFSVDTSLLEFTDKAGEMNFNLVSDADWSSSKNAEWFSTTPESGNGNTVVNVFVEENKSIEERTGTIVYSYADKSTNVNVHQLAKYMTIDNQAFEFDSKGGSHTIELSTNDTWTVKTEVDAPWLKFSHTSGSGDAVITMTAEDNPSVNGRSTVVIIDTENAQSVRILVSQKPRYLTVSTESVTFFAKGGSSELISIDTDGKYEITTDATWFTVNKEEGDKFIVYATKNPSPDLRRGKITIALTDLVDCSLALEISVIQSGEGESFIVDGYPEDVDWNFSGNDSLSVSVVGYTADKNWDKDFGSLMNVQIDGYSEDKDWNQTSK